MNAALYRHSSVHVDVLGYMLEKYKGSDIRWLADYDCEVFRSGRTVKARVDLAGFSRKHKTVEIAIEIAVTTIKKDGQENYLAYEAARIPKYLWVNCVTGECHLFKFNGLSYEKEELEIEYPGLKELVAAAIAESEAIEKDD